MAAFGVGQAAEGIKNSAFNTFLLFYYQQVLGVSGLVTGTALAIALVFDAVTDPIAGSISDKVRTRWGRRHPFILVSALPLAASFILLFHPPAGASEPLLFVWLTLFAVLVRGSLTFYHVPHLALGAEMAHDYNQRSTLFAFSTLFGALGGAFTGFFAYRFFFPTTLVYNPGLLNPEGYLGFGYAGAVVMLVLILVCVFGTAREIPHLKQPLVTVRFSVARVVRELRDLLGNKSFRSIFFGMLLASSSLAIEAVFQPYMGVHFWGLTTEKLSLIPLVGLVGLLASLPLTPVITRALDKKLAVVSLAVIAIFNSNLLICLRLLDVPWFPTNESPWILRFVLILFFVQACFVPVIFTSLNSMFADISDEHELETGERREGIIYSARSFTQKATGALGVIIGGAILDLIAFPRGAELGTVPADTVWSLGFFQGPATSIFTIAGVLLYLGYRIDRARHAEILEQLEARRVAT